MDSSLPLWLHMLAETSLLLAAICAIVIAIDESLRPQPMWVMNLVWPLCALFGSVIWLFFYFRWGRGAAHNGMAQQEHDGHTPHKSDAAKPPFAIMTGKATSHCGAGCVLGDLLAETLAFCWPALAVAFGWKTLFGERIFAVWLLDFVFAFILGIGFQYFTIAPMRHLSVGNGLAAALKADAASIASWQIGMYGLMALAQFGWMTRVHGAPLRADRPEFWFLMQIAMLAGFVTSYPVNWLLLKAGVKEEM